MLDDPDAELTGAWIASTSLAPYVGAGYRFTGERDTANDGSAIATFRFTAATGGTYQLNMAYTPDPTRATNVTLTVTSGAHSSSFFGRPDSPATRQQRGPAHRYGCTHRWN